MQESKMALMLTGRSGLTGFSSLSSFSKWFSKATIGSHHMDDIEPKKQLRQGSGCCC
jgi:hypothetical protein